MRKYKTVKFRGSRYPEIDAQITEYINGRLSQVRFQNTHVTSPVDEGGVWVLNCSISPSPRAYSHNLLPQWDVINRSPLNKLKLHQFWLHHFVDDINNWSF